MESSSSFDRFLDYIDASLRSSSIILAISGNHSTLIDIRLDFFLILYSTLKMSINHR
jgi:hypothetical protein